MRMSSVLLVPLFLFFFFSLFVCTAPCYSTTVCTENDSHEVTSNEKEHKGKYSGKAAKHTKKAKLYIY